MRTAAEQYWKIDFSKYSNRQLVNKLLQDGILYIEWHADLIWYFLTRRWLHWLADKVKENENYYTVNSSMLRWLSSIFMFRVMICLNNNDKLLEMLLESEHPAAIEILKRLKERHYWWISFWFRSIARSNPVLALKLIQNKELREIFTWDDLEYLQNFILETRKRAIALLEDVQPLLTID